ncbi:hypothetical protein Afil01_11630 [Actinorhabdospora filicis]|uniref:DUF4245 domain-containing protein n=1 Tax=Actinorhabdospora filicis TaxID=1785913 RepID=A0A9W6W8D1_9ACTN|nr:DUF4245 domain-containing protein [Actinorhabdospora filicis]GLZ76356.1 hypothetical protein Afil01_11630 [Actinorhabdospora filicis]
MSSHYTQPRRPRDMALSLAVILVPIALILGGWRLLSSGTDPGIDPSARYQEAADSGLSVLRPSALDGWRATTAAVARTGDGVTLRVGYVGPNDSGVQLIESSVEAEKLLGNELGEQPRLEGNVESRGRMWQSYVTRDGNAAMVWTQDGRTIIVIGDAKQADLMGIADGLQ